MDWKATRPAIEIAAESIAAAFLGGAVGFAVLSFAPLEAGIVAASAAGVVAALGALFLVGRVDRRSRALGERFAPVDFTAEGEILLLDDPVDYDDALLLDDPLPALADDKRVVRLFSLPAGSEEASPLPAPGEMAARIENFLGVARGGGAVTGAAADRPPADASAALHAALADIRRSLRHG